jgi:hypothetical protein
LKDNGPIQGTDVEATYKEIVKAGRGYCADVVDVYMALALAARLPVRAWAFSFDGFGGHGHVVVEIFDDDAQQWVMLDVFNNVMPVAGSLNRTMSVREFLQNFRERESEVRFLPLVRDRSLTGSTKLRAYYRRVSISGTYGRQQCSFTRPSRSLIASVGRVSQAGALVASLLDTFRELCLCRPQRTPITLKGCSRCARAC